jgi:hypothetical protein
MWFYMKYIVKNQWPNTFGTSLYFLNDALYLNKYENIEEKYSSRFKHKTKFWTSKIQYNDSTFEDK